MKITFDLRNTGLGNNGGSLTLIKSGNTLTKMGHDVVFIDSYNNQNTWVKLLADHKIIKNRNDVPEADVIIATGYNSVSETVNSPSFAGIKFHWIRGFELWRGSEDWIINKILKAPTIKLVNGLCLQKKLKKLGFESYLIRPGYDFENLKPLNIRDTIPEVVLGGLNKQGRHANSKRTSWIFETAKVLKRKYKGKIKLYMFGMDKLPATTSIDHFIKNPNIDQKNEIYNNCDIWLAPTMLEGLHMPPAEAMMTECSVVGTNAEMAGTEDYLIDGKSGVVTNNDIVSFIAGVESLVLNESLRKQYGKNGRKRILEIGNREKNMLELIELINALKG